jgi:hypothetical protein
MARPPRQLHHTGVIGPTLGTIAVTNKDVIVMKIGKDGGSLFCELAYASTV